MKKVSKKKWLSQYAFHHKKDEVIYWYEIDSYRYSIQRFSSILILYLINGKKYCLIHYYLDNGKDDFCLFINKFIQTVEERNNAEIDKRNHIQLGKTFFATTTAFIVAIVCAVLMIGLPFLFYFYTINRRLEMFSYLIFYPIALYYILLVRVSRIERKKYEHSFV